MAEKTLKLTLVGEDKSASKSLKNLGDEAEKSTKKLGGMKTVAGGVLAADFAKAAGEGIVKFGADSVGAFRDAEAAQRKLEDAYKRFPGLADVSIGKLRDLNSAIEAKTGADADDLAASQATLAQYGLTGKQIAELTPLLDDYATKTGKDLPSAAQDLGKAMLGQGKALKNVGIDFKNAGSVGKNFDQVVGGLRKQVGGFAESEATTADGSLKRLKTQFGNVQEEVGSKLLPILTRLLEIGLQVINWAQRNEGTLQAVATVVGILAAGYVILAAAQALSNAQAAIAAAGGILQFLRAWAAQQAILNVIMSANPIALVVIAIAALIAGLILAYKHSETFRKVVDTAFRAIGQAATWLWNNALAPMIRFILRGFAAVADKIASFLSALSRIPGFGWAKGAADKMRGAADQARRLADNIKNIPNKTVTVTTNFKTRGSRESTARDVAKATGGYITGPGTGTSDSIPAWLSNGEYVVRASAVRALGVSRLDYANRTGRMPGFRDGGLVGRRDGGAPVQQNNYITEADDPWSVAAHIGRRLEAAMAA